MEYNRVKYELTPGDCKTCQLRAECEQYIIADDLISLDNNESCLFVKGTHYEAAKLPQPIFVLNENHR